jgi:hypothetical protein
MRRFGLRRRDLRAPRNPLIRHCAGGARLCSFFFPVSIHVSSWSILPTHQHQVAYVDESARCLAQRYDRIVFPENGVSQEHSGPGETEVPEADGDVTLASSFGRNPLNQEPGGED